MYIPEAKKSNTAKLQKVEYCSKDIDPNFGIIVVVVITVIIHIHLIVLMVSNLYLLNWKKNPKIIQ